MDAPLDACHATLSAEEAARAARYRVATDRDRFVVGRAGLRSLLADVLGRPHRDVEFSFGPFGKPSLVRQPNDPDVRFSLSHAGDSVVWAVAPGRSVGVDVEEVRGDALDDEVLVATMTPREIRRLTTVPDAQKADEFFLAWTAKEAYSKALGVGLAIPLADIEALSPLLLGDDLRLPGHPAGRPISVRPIEVRPGYRAALAVEGPIGTAAVAPGRWSGDHDDH